jgi:hypothetical protein
VELQLAAAHEEHGEQKCERAMDSSASASARAAAAAVEECSLIRSSPNGTPPRHLRLRSSTCSAAPPRILGATLSTLQQAVLTLDNTSHNVVWSRQQPQSAAPRRCDVAVDLVVLLPRLGPSTQRRLYV